MKSINDPAQFYNDTLGMWKDGNTSEAAKSMEKLLSEYPRWEHGVAAYHLASIYTDLGDKQKSLFWCSMAVILDKTDERFVIGYMSQLHEIGLTDEAIYLAEALIDNSKSTNFKTELRDYVDALVKMKVETSN